MRQIWGRARSHALCGHLLRFRPLALVVALIIVLASATATAEAPTGDVLYGKLRRPGRAAVDPRHPTPRAWRSCSTARPAASTTGWTSPGSRGCVRSGWIVASSDFHTASWGNEASTAGHRST